ncbi:MAG: hypothetical protein O6943_04235 [Bacteroidetes bacterium]|nr:hypothetical protein [Bacteroidota bacterium]
MDLNEITNIVQILGILALLYGMRLGLKQFKLHRNQRRDFAIMECARSFEDKEFTEAYRLISALEPGQTMAQLNALGEEFEIAALRIGMKFETVGLLVFKGVVPIDAMEDLVGGAALTVWKVIEKWVIQTRLDRSHSSFWEWYQWLVDRLIERGESNRAPAFVAHKNWKSPSQ